MIRLATALILLCATFAFAVLMGYDVDGWVGYTPAIVVGEIATVAPAEDRGLGYEPDELWLYPHSVARIKVQEVLKNSTACPIVVGDTVSLYFPTSDVGHNPEMPNMAQSVEDTPMPAFRPSQTGIFGLRLFEAEWRVGDFYCFRESTELPEIREALRKLLTKKDVKKE